MLSCNISPCQKIKQNFVAANLLLSLFLPFVSTALQDGRSSWNAMVSSRSWCLVRQSVPAFLLFFMSRHCSIYRRCGTFGAERVNHLITSGCSMIIAPPGIKYLWIIEKQKYRSYWLVQTLSSLARGRTQEVCGRPEKHICWLGSHYTWKCKPKFSNTNVFFKIQSYVDTVISL